MKSTVRTLWLGLSFALVALVVAACSAPGNLIDYRADLSPANEVPPVDSMAEGFVDFELTGNVLSTADSAVINLSSAPVAAHIHDGCAGENGPVLFTFDISSDPDGEGNDSNLSGTFTLSDAQIQRLNADCLYVNVHTVNYPNGELRGQIDGLLE